MSVDVGSKAPDFTLTNQERQPVTLSAQRGKPVVLASRCPNGVVTPLYAFEGGGAGLVAMGVVPAGPRTPSQARMELVLALSAGVAYARR